MSKTGTTVIEDMNQRCPPQASSAHHNLTPRERWQTLRKDILTEINKIDKDTPWQETEPEWWLEMMELHRTISASMVKKPENKLAKKHLESMLNRNQKV